MKINNQTSEDTYVIIFTREKKKHHIDHMELTVLFGNMYWSREMLFAVCSRPKMEKPSCFFLSKKTFILLTGTSTMGTHFSAVTLHIQQIIPGNYKGGHNQNNLYNQAFPLQLRKNILSIK